MISHKHKFIFVHIPKTGGTSIEKVFHPKTPIGSDGAWHYPSADKHYTLKMIEKKYPISSDYFKFSFVRNPWDMTISQYHFMWKSCNRWPVQWRDKHKIFSELSFKEWLLHPFFQSPCIRSVNIATRGGTAGTLLEWVTGVETNIDFIGKFETLQADFNTVCDKIGIPQRQLPHCNKTNHKHYTEYYDDETREIVAEKYAKDIEYFDYEFGE